MFSDLCDGVFTSKTIPPPSHKRSASTIRHARPYDCLVSPLIIEEVGQPLIIAFRALGDKTEFTWEHDRHQPFLRIKLQDSALTVTDLDNIPNFTISEAHRDNVPNIPPAVVEFSINIPDCYDLSNVADFYNGALMGVSIPLVARHTVHKIVRTVTKIDVHTEGQPQ